MIPFETKKPVAMPAPTKQAPVTETDIEINLYQPPFEGPDYSTPDTYWEDNGFLYAEEFGVIIDVSTKQVGSALIYHRPPERIIDEEDNVKILTCYDPLPLQPDQLSRITSIERTYNHPPLDDEVAAKERITYLGGREYALSTELFGVSALYRGDTVVDFFDYDREDAPVAMTPEKRRDVFETTLERGGQSIETMGLGRLVLNPAPDWKHRAIMLYQQGYSKSPDKCKRKALEDEGLERTP